MKTQILIITAIITLLAGCTGNVTGNVVLESDQLRVGAVLPLTSWGAYYGEAIQQGMQLAIKDLGQKNNIKLFVEDTQSDTTKAVTAANKLITVNSIDVLHVEFSGPSNAISPISAANNKLLLYDSFSVTPVTNNEYAFKLFYDPKAECAQLAEHALSKQYKNIATVMPLADYNQECYEAILETVKGRGNIEQYNFDIAEKDFRSILTRMKATNIEAVIMLGYENNFLQFLKQKKELGFNDLAFYCGPQDDCLSEKIQNTLPSDALEGVVVFDVEITQEFTQRYLREPGTQEKDLLGAATGYDAIMLLSDAYTICGNKDRDCLRAAMISSSYNTAVVTSTGFDKNRRMTLESVLKEFREGSIQVVE